MKESDLFLAALEIESPEERNAYLDSVCGDDASLRQRIEQLLRSHEDAGSLLDQPAIQAVRTELFSGGKAAPAVSGDTLPELEAQALSYLTPCDNPDVLGQLGQYEILEVVGRGGMFGGFIGNRSTCAETPGNPAAGSWAGIFTTDNGFWGPVVFNIDSSGVVIGEATFYPGGVAGDLVGHVNDDGFGFYAFRNEPDSVIPYLLYVEVDENGDLNAIAPGLGWTDFTVTAVLEPQ